MKHMKRLRASLPPDLILEHLAVGVFTVDPGFRITSFNAQAEEMTGFTRDEALGRLCYEIFRADMCFLGQCALRRAMDSETSIVRERAAILDKHNLERPVEITAAVLRDETGAVVGGVETILDDSDRAALEKRIKSSYSFEDVVGKSPAMQTLFEALPVLAASEATVLILGETGTGKGLLARAVHNASPRKDGPFVKINCAALPANLLESELFGYRKGAFTDAKADKPGMFELAHGGTVFLDEIGEMDVGLQAKLLQVLEDKEFYPLGGTRPARSDARVIASTNRDLAGMVRQGAFRADLFYRLQVAQLDLPPLRERREDVPLLADHFLQELGALDESAASGLSRAGLRVIMEHDLPGNARELRNILEYAAALKPGGVIEPRDLPRYLLQSANATGPPPRPGPAGPAPTPDDLPGQNRAPNALPTPTAGSPTDSIPPAASAGPAQPRPEGAEPTAAPAPASRRQRLERALAESGWSRTRAAALLGVSRTTLWRRMKQEGLA
ncbi:MAG: sigma-54 interaction domain-containing protein [Desulfovibrionaceae bacterium]